MQKKNCTPPPPPPFPAPPQISDGSVKDEKTMTSLIKIIWWSRTQTSRTGQKWRPALWNWCCFNGGYFFLSVIFSVERSQSQWFASLWSVLVQRVYALLDICWVNQKCFHQSCSNRQIRSVELGFTPRRRGKDSNGIPIHSSMYYNLRSVQTFYFK